MEVRENEEVRRFYTVWRDLNRECMSAGHDTEEKILQFVAAHLEYVLQNLPATQTIVSVFDVWYANTTVYTRLFEDYMRVLDHVSRIRPA